MVEHEHYRQLDHEYGAGSDYENEQRGALARNVFGNGKNVFFAPGEDVFVFHAISLFAHETRRFIPPAVSFDYWLFSGAIQPGYRPFFRPRRDPALYRFRVVAGENPAAEKPGRTKEEITKTTS